jgi:hypothetical protein
VLLVSERMERRAIFGRPDPPNIVAVLDETVLRRLIGSAQVMHDQLTELAELSTRPYISIEVVPADVGIMRQDVPAGTLSHLCGPGLGQGKRRPAATRRPSGCGDRCGVRG